MEESTYFLDRHLAQTTMHPFALEIEYAKGVFIYSTSGKRYFDFISGVGVSNIGHSHPHIQSALKEQIDRHLHVMVYGEYGQSAQTKAAALLTSLLPPQLDCCYFVNSGTEANEAALKLAKRVTGRSRIVSCRGSYHGSTHGSLSVSGNEMKKSAFRPLLPNIYFIKFNEREDLHFIDSSTACVIMETIQGDAGIRIPDQAYLEAVRKRCDETGALLIFDEIQCGMGRAGRFFAFEHYNVIPDVLTLGKALGGGLPVGCMVSSREKMQQFTHSPMLGHISTFAGHPLVCASVAANMEVMINERVIESVQRKGDQIARKLASHPSVKALRYRGLFFAIDLKDEKEVQRVVETCLEKGLISFWFLSCPWSFRIAPPLTITDEEVEEACDIILSALNKTK